MKSYYDHEDGEKLTYEEYDKMITEDAINREKRNKALKNWTYCSECGGRIDGKLYWYKDKLYCKNCLIKHLLKDGVIYDNWHTNC